MSLTTTVDSQASPLTSRLYGPSPTSSTGTQWKQDTDNGAGLPTGTPLWNEVQPYKVVPMSNFTDPNGFMNSKMNVVSSTCNYNPMFNNSTYLLPSCEREVPNIHNGFCGSTLIMPPTNGMMNTPNNLAPCRKIGSGVASNSNNWAAHGNTERFTRPAWAPVKSSGGVKKHKRVRTAFTSQQMMELEQEYARTRYLDRTRRIELADALHLNERTIKIWFQNRRMKEKKDRAESYDDPEEPSTTDSSPELMNKPVPTHTQGVLIQCNPPNGVFNQGNYYTEQYPATSNANIPQINMMQGTSQSVMNYPTFVLDNSMQLQDDFISAPSSQLKIEKFEPCNSTTPQISTHESPLHSDNSALDSGRSDVNDQNWDLSWIRSMNFEEDV